MNCDSQASTQLIYVENNPVVRNSDYKLDLWRELSKRWMVIGVLLVMTLAVLAPKVGAPGGPLHTHYLSYPPLWYIWYSCGTRVSPRVPDVPHTPHAPRVSRTPPVPPARLLALVCVHAHVVSPALAVVVVSALRDVTDYRIVKGALFASVGGPCAWLAGALAPHALAAPLLLGAWLAAALAVPLSMRLLCGRIVLPSLTSALPPVLSTIVPYSLGILYPSRLDPSASKLCALALLYVETCEALRHAEGVLYLSDVLVVVLLELTHLVTSAASCYAYARCELVSEQHWKLLAVCSVPKEYTGSVLVSACDVWGLTSVPAAIAVPLRAALLAAIAHEE